MNKTTTILVKVLIFIFVIIIIFTIISSSSASTSLSMTQDEDPVYLVPDGSQFIITNHFNSSIKLYLRFNENNKLRFVEDKSQATKFTLDDSNINDYYYIRWGNTNPKQLHMGKSYFVDNTIFKFGSYYTLQKESKDKNGKFNRLFKYIAGVEETVSTDPGGNNKFKYAYTNFVCIGTKPISLISGY